MNTATNVGVFDALTDCSSLSLSSAGRTAILVLGVHGPETDAFTHVAHQLGGDLPGDPDAITQFNERMLAAAGSRWDDWLPLNPGWSGSAVRADFLTRAQDLLRAQFGTSPLIVLADLGICRLASFWLEALEALGVRPVVALPQYDPVEVSQMLGARYGFQEGFGQLLWLRHVLEAEAATREVPRLFFGNDQLLADWGGVVGDFEKLADLSFSRRSVLVESKITAFLAHEARENRERGSDGSDTTQSAWVQESRVITERWCRGERTPGDLARLDAIRSEFDAAAPSFSRVIASGIGADGELGAAEITQALVRARDDLAQRLEDAAAEIERLRSEYRRSDEAEKEAARLKDELADLGSALRQRQEEAVQAWAEVTIERQARERAEAEVCRAIDQNQRLSDGLARIEARIGADAEALAEARFQTSEAERALAALRVRMARSDDELAQLTVLYAEAEDRHRQQEHAREADEAAARAAWADETHRKSEWLRQATMALRGQPAWWSMLGANARQRNERALLEARGLFDSAAYLARNPDVAQDGMDPLVHYMNHGLFEGRSW